MFLNFELNSLAVLDELDQQLTKSSDRQTDMSDLNYFFYFLRFFIPYLN